MYGVENLSRSNVQTNIHELLANIRELLVNIREVFANIRELVAKLMKVFVQSTIYINYYNHSPL